MAWGNLGSEQQEMGLERQTGTMSQNKATEKGQPSEAAGGNKAKVSGESGLTRGITQSWWVIQGHTKQ